MISRLLCPLGALCLLFLCLPTTYCASYEVFRRKLEEDSVDEEDSSLSSYLSPTPTPTPSTSTTEAPRSEPLLSGNAIANIICSALALIFLTGVLCYTSYSFSKHERHIRVKTALENNKLIDKQLAAAKAKVDHRNQSSATVSLLADSKTSAHQSISSTASEGSSERPLIHGDVTLSAVQSLRTQGPPGTAATSSLVVVELDSHPTKQQQELT